MIKKNIKKIKENTNIINEYEFKNIPVNKKRQVISRVISERAKPIIRKTISAKKNINEKTIVKQKKDKNDVIPEAQQSNSSIPNWLIILIMIILMAIIKALLARY